MPDVTDEEEKTEDDTDRYNAATTWTCPTCTNVNQMNVEACGICRTKKPKIIANTKSFWWMRFLTLIYIVKLTINNSEIHLKAII